MNARDLARVNAINQMGDFGAKNAADWTPTAPAKPTKAQANAKALFALLNAEKTGVVARLAAFTAGQQEGTADYHGGTVSKSTLRHGLMEDLKTLNEGAAAIARKLKRPDIMAGFRMPHGVSDVTLAAEARSFAAHAEPLADEFELLGQEDDFTGALEERVQEFEQAKDDKGESLGDQVGAGKGLEATIEEGLTIMAQLVVLLKKLYKGDAVKLGMVATASHVQRAPKRKPSVTPTPGGAPAAP